MRIARFSSFAVLCLVLSSCSLFQFTIEGKVTASKSLNAFTFWLILLDSTGVNHRYYIRPNANGEFRVQVWERGSYQVALVLDRFPRGTWRSPRLSCVCDSPSFVLTIGPAKTQRLPDIYVTEPVEVFSPRNGDRIPLSGNFTFSWSGDKTVDFYYLTFYQKTKEDQAHGVLTVGGIKSNSISLLQIRKAKVLPTQIDHSAIKKLGVFKTGSSDLSPGEYDIGIIGVVDSPTESSYFDITESDSEPTIRLY